MTNLITDGCLSAPVLLVVFILFLFAVAMDGKIRERRK